MRIELAAIAERISSARERLRAVGRPWGRPPRLTPRNIEIVLVRQKAAEGLSQRRIAQELRIPKSIIGRALASRNPTPVAAA